MNNEQWKEDFCKYFDWELESEQIFSIEELIKEQKKEIITDLLKIADEGEIKDLRIEVEKYALLRGLIIK